MKKILLALITSASLTACHNGEVFVEVLPPLQEEYVSKPIMFDIYADKTTRAQATNLEAYHNTFVVYGTKENDGMQTVFDGVTVTHKAGASAPNEWTYSPLRYWDKQGSYEFIAYAPASAPVAYTLAGTGKVTGGKFATTATYTLTGQNIQKGISNEEIYVGFDGKSGHDTDIMLSDKTTAEGKTKQLVNLNFRHILAKLNVAVKKKAAFAPTITIKSITITGLHDSGTYTDDAGWTSSSVDPNYKLQYADATGVAVSDTKQYFVESLVMPQAMGGKLTIVYEINTGGYTETYTYVVDVKDVFTTRTHYEKGSNYTITFTIDPSDAIMFKGNVATWDEKGDASHEID